MSADGAWTLTINSPMGKQEAGLTLKTDGAALTGVQTAQGQTADITDGKIDGVNLSWSAAITTPFPMTLDFAGTVSGDAMSGQVKAGAFGSFPFQGQRA